MFLRPPHPLFALTMGFPGSSGAGGAAANSAEVQQYLDRLSTPPTPGSAEEIRIAAFIDGLVADGVWAKLDALNLWFAAENEGDAHVNLIQSSFSTSRREFSGTCTFTLHQGFSGGLSTRCLTSNFNASVEAVAGTPSKFQRNSGSFGIWIYSTATVAQSAVDDGVYSSGMTSNGKMELWPKYDASNGEHNCNGSAEAFTAGADSSGFYIVRRSGANAGRVTRNNVLMDSTVAASTALPNTTIWYRVQHSCRMAFIGSAMSDAEETAFYNRLTTLVTAITGGVP